MEEQKSLRTITPISEDNMKKIMDMSAAALPDRPSQQGMKPEQIKKRFYEPIVNSDISVIKEVNRIVDEANAIDGQLRGGIDSEHETNDKQDENITKLQGGVGDLNSLDIDLKTSIDTKTSLVDAINNFLNMYKNKVGTCKDVNELDVLIAELKGLHDALSDFINEDAETLKTNSQQVVTAINELLGIINQIKEDYATTSAVSDGYVSKSGDSVVNGTLSVKNLIVEGDSEIADTQHLWVKDAVIVANSDGVQLAGVHGYIIRVDADVAYGIVYEPSSNTLKIGEGEYLVESYPDANLETKTRVVFTFDDEQGQAIATRGNIGDGNIPKWNGEKFTFEDSEKAADKLVAVTQEIADGNLAKWKVDGHTFVDTGKPADKVALQDGTMGHGMLPVWDIGKGAWVNSGKTPEMLQAVGSANVVANALKGRASGKTVQVNDVSSLVHELEVKVRSENLFDIVNSAKTFNYPECTTVSVDSTSIVLTTKNSISYPWLDIIPKNQLNLFGDDITIFFDFAQSGDESQGCPTVLVKITNGEVSKQLISQKSGPVTVNVPEYTEGDELHILFYNPGTYNTNEILTVQRTATYTNVQIKKGTTETEYKHYVDVGNVKLLVRGENILDIDGMMEGYSTLSKEGNGCYKITMLNNCRAAKTKQCFIPAGTKLTFSAIQKNNSREDTDGNTIHIYCLNASGAYAGSLTLTTSTDSVTRVVNQDTAAIRLYIDNRFGNNGYVIFEKPQLRIGDNVGEYEPFCGSEYTISSDGTVVGAKSVSPTMMLLTDTPNTVIECKYNRDVNKAFAQLEARLSALEKGGKEQ